MNTTHQYEGESNYYMYHASFADQEQQPSIGACTSNLILSILESMSVNFAGSVCKPDLQGIAPPPPRYRTIWLYLITKGSDRIEFPGVKLQRSCQRDFDRGNVCSLVAQPKVSFRTRTDKDSAGVSRLDGRDDANRIGC